MHPRSLANLLACASDSRYQKLNLPDSSVHWSCFLISSAVTVGLTLSSDFKKSARRNGGSRSSSLSMSVHAFSSASGSPGEHGVHFFRSSIYLKCVAERTLRTGCMSASRTTIAMSDPEYLDGNENQLLAEITHL